jgi:LacI family transcriptional regulator/LacI family purine nucleotide synthesis repressor
MAEKTVTMADIAARAGVSTVSVSKALSGQKGVSTEVREKITELAHEMGYRRTSRTFGEKDEPMTIGILVSERFMREERSFYWSAIQQITKAALEKSCFCVLEVIDAEDEKAGNSSELLLADKAEGIIALGTFTEAFETALMRDARVPVLFADARPRNPESDALMSDNYSGGRTMTEYLIGLGHRKIAYVGTLLVTSSIDERYFGYVRALMGQGIRVREDWVIPDRDPSDAVIDPLAYISLPADMPEAFFCNCDMTALLLIRKLEEAGFRVPQDISVVGYDNFLPRDDIEAAGITTYAIDLKDFADKAIHMIRHKIISSYSYGLVSVSGTFLLRNSAMERRMH